MIDQSHPHIVGYMLNSYSRQACMVLAFRYGPAHATCCRRRLAAPARVGEDDLWLSTAETLLRERETAAAAGIWARKLCSASGTRPK